MFLTSIQSNPEAKLLTNLGLLSIQQKSPSIQIIMNHPNEIYRLNQIAEIQVTYKPIYKYDQRMKITTSQDAIELLRKVWNKGTINFNEEFLAIYLNRANQVLGVYKHSSGTESALKKCRGSCYTNNSTGIPSSKPARNYISNEKRFQWYTYIRREIQSCPYFMAIRRIIYFYL